MVQTSAYGQGPYSQGVGAYGQGVYGNNQWEEGRWPPCPCPTYIYPPDTYIYHTPHLPPPIVTTPSSLPHPFPPTLTTPSTPITPTPPPPILTTPSPNTIRGIEGVDDDDYGSTTTTHLSKTKKSMNGVSSLPSHLHESTTTTPTPTSAVIEDTIARTQQYLQHRLGE